MQFRFVLVLVVLFLAACGSSQQVKFEDLPPGDAARGETLFTQSVGGAPSCSTCHTVNGDVSVGPSLQNFMASAQSHAPDKTAQQYAHTSIVRPGETVVSGFSNVMYSQYGRHLSAQQMADLIAYLLTL